MILVSLASLFALWLEPSRAPASIWLYVRYSIMLPLLMCHRSRNASVDRNIVFELMCGLLELHSWNLCRIDTHSLTTSLPSSSLSISPRDRLAFEICLRIILNVTLQPPQLADEEGPDGVVWSDEMKDFIRQT